MTPILTSRLRILTAAFAFAAAPALFAQGDMESDWLPNTTLFFDELLPSHAAQEEAETLADLARIFDNSLLTVLWEFSLPFICNPPLHSPDVCTPGSILE